MSTLAEFEALVAAALVDASHVRFSTATLEAAIRQALGDYTAAIPRAIDTVIELPGNGVEIDLSSFTDGLLQVTEVVWPYVWDIDDNAPYNLVSGFSLAFDDGAPILRLVSNSTPAEGDSLRLWYTVPHTIEDLDSETVTTVAADHEALLVLGASGYAYQSRASELAEAVAPNRYAVRNYKELAAATLADFKIRLTYLTGRAISGDLPSQASGWRLDEYDL